MSHVEKLTQKVTQLLEARDAENANFKTGDHVHMNNNPAYARGTNPSLVKHGVVSKHTASSAHVKWEDGSETTHGQTGIIHGSKHDYSPKKINHSTIYSTNENGFSSNKKVTNDEHKAHLQNKWEEHKAQKSHEENVSHLKNHFANAGHFNLKPDHVAAIHKILDEAGVKRPE